MLILSFIEDVLYLGGKEVNVKKKKKKEYFVSHFGACSIHFVITGP